jgi:hypothetical protein
MVLPDRVFAIVSALFAQHGALASGDDDARRSLQKMIVETVVKRHPGEGWGWKRADPGRPLSKDTIANNLIEPGHIIAWDCFDGATRTPVQRDSMLIDDQVFVEVSGFDHLNGVILVPQPRRPDPQRSPGPAPTQTVGHGEFFEALNWIDKLYREQLGRSNGVDLEGIAAHVYGVYVGERQRGASVADAKAKVVSQINSILGRTDIHV